MSSSFNTTGFNGIDLSNLNPGDIAKFLSMGGYDQMFVLVGEGEYDGTRFSGRVVTAAGPVGEVSPLLRSLTDENFDLGRFVSSSATAKPAVGAPQAPKPALPSVPAPQAPKPAPQREEQEPARLQCVELINGTWQPNGHTCPNTVADVLEAQKVGWQRARKTGKPSTVVLVPKGYRPAANEEVLDDLVPRAQATASEPKDDGKLFKGRRRRASR